MENLFNIITFGVFSKNKKVSEFETFIDSELDLVEEETTKKKFKVIAVIDECDNEKDALKMVLNLNAKRDGLNYTYKIV